MIKLLQNIKEPKKIIFAVAFVATFAVPVAVQAHSRANVTGSQQVQTEVQTTERKKPNVILVQQTETEVEQETPTEPTTPPQAPDVIVEGSVVAQALTVAESEHPGSVVIAFKAKSYAGVAAYKFYFADNWKVVVKADDLSVLKSVSLKDKKNELHHWKKQFKNRWFTHHDRRDNDSRN